MRDRLNRIFKDESKQAKIAKVVRVFVIQWRRGPCGDAALW